MADGDAHTGVHVCTIRSVPSRQFCLVFVGCAQSGIRSSENTSYTWHILAAAPAVAVVRRPDLDSGAVRPVFAFAADWDGVDPDGAERNLTFEVLLLSDADLGVHHVPLSCDPSRPVSATHRDCARADCSSTWCLYTLFLLTSKVRMHLCGWRHLGCGGGVVHDCCAAEAVKHLAFEASIFSRVHVRVRLHFRFIPVPGIHLASACEVSQQRGRGHRGAVDICAVLVCPVRSHIRFGDSRRLVLDASWHGTPHGSP